MRVPRRSTMPQPQWRVPGSTPATLIGLRPSGTLDAALSLSLDALQLLVAHVEVREDILDVVVVV
jgi:hypothetical protein